MGWKQWGDLEAAGCLCEVVDWNQAVWKEFSQGILTGQLECREGKTIGPGMEGVIRKRILEQQKLG